ncbi:hypothetical protein X749_31620 [Mesorhizobium sp. LNJC391B00]|nr:hypothetical protein X749_31620 [Mesorhizobium sp. LNJC391B00]
MLLCSRFGCRQEALGFQPEKAVRKVWFWAIGDLRLMGFAATRTIVLHATLPDKCSSWPTLTGAIGPGAKRHHQEGSGHADHVSRL